MAPARSRTAYSGRFQGVWTALITPFRETGEIDFDVYRKLVRRQKDAGVHGVVPCGTTGESPTLTTDEKKQLIEVAIEELEGTGVGVIAGTGSNNTEDTVRLSKWASEQGADGLLLVCPYYNKPSQAGLEAHFLAVAESCDCPVMLYNVPGRTVTALAAETVVRLAAHPRIIAIKEATANPAFASQIRAGLAGEGRSLTLVSGDDPTWLSFLAVGGEGVVSVTSNFLPAEMVELYSAAGKGDFASALKVHEKLFPVFRDMFIEPNPVPLKFAMEQAGLCEAKTRLPLTPLLPASAESLLKTLRKAGALAMAGEATR